MIFHAFVRNQEFITRLQLPIFMITPLMWGAFASRRLPGAGLRAYLLRLATIACMMAGYVTACTNQFKPVSIPTLLSMSRDYYYYAVSRTIGIDFETPQDATLTMLGATGCRRLGLYIPGDSWEYPLTWRAMRLGVRVKHYTTPSRWPCLIFSNSGPPPGVSAQTWIEAGTPLVYRPQEQDREP